MRPVTMTAPITIPAMAPDDSLLLCAAAAVWDDELPVEVVELEGADVPVGIKLETSADGRLSPGATI